MSRGLRAVVFTDIVGSTAAMQADESEARRLRRRHRSAVEGSTARWGGEVVQYFGDGSLAVFGSAVDAVHCALDIQEAVRRPPPVPLRIGIHSGDVVRDDDGVFGDAVNVAARLEGLAVPGSILLSDKVHDEIKNQPGLETVSLGELHLRNVARPTGVHAVAAPGLTVPSRDDLGPGGTAPPTGVAVLPFANLSDDPENAWFADGLAEELIHALSRLPGMKVTARTSSFAFRDRQQDVREIGRALGVGTVLEGSVRRAGPRIRLTAQLVNADDGFHLFSQVYDRTLDDVFAVQDELARTILAELQPRLLDTPTPPRRTDAGGSRSWNGGAYEQFLRARAEVARWTPASMRRAIDYCRRSIELDPRRPEPWATQATAWVFLGSLGQIPPEEAYGEAEAAIAAALDIDPHDATALTNRALRLLFFEGDGEEASRVIAHALTVSPGLVFAHQAHAYVLLNERRFDAAVHAAEAAVQLDPLSPPLLDTLGVAYLAADRPADARRVLERALTIAPTFRSAIQTLAWACLIQGDIDRSVELMDSLPDLAGFAAAAAGPRGYLYAVAGRPDRARAMLSLIRERREAEPHVQLDLDEAMIRMALDEIDEVVRLLERVAARNRGTLVFVRWSSLWDPVRDDPRVRALLDG